MLLVVWNFDKDKGSSFRRENIAIYNLIWYSSWSISLECSFLVIRTLQRSETNITTSSIKCVLMTDHKKLLCVTLCTRRFSGAGGVCYSDVRDCLSCARRRTTDSCDERLGVDCKPTRTHRAYPARQREGQHNINPGHSEHISRAHNIDGRRSAVARRHLPMRARCSKGSTRSSTFSHTPLTRNQVERSHRLPRGILAEGGG